MGVEARCKELNILNMASGNESEVITPIETTDDDDDVGWEPPVTVTSYRHFPKPRPLYGRHFEWGQVIKFH